MIPNRNRQVRLKSRPAGIPTAEHFDIVETPLPALQDGQVLVRNRFLSVDPAMRGWAVGDVQPITKLAIGEMMRAQAAGEVIASRHAGFAVGDKVVGRFGWQDYAVTAAAAILRKIAASDLPMSLSLGVLGINGLTAYFGMLDIAQPRPGDTVVVSTAAGSVGSAAGQMAKIAGCRTVGITGGAAKAGLCREEFGYDAVIDYKAATDLDRALAETCPDGVDVYFDNTAGAISDAVRGRLNAGARIAQCGVAAIPNWLDMPQGPRVELDMLVKRIRLQGFTVNDYRHRYDEGLHRLTAWVREGRLRYREDILDGLEQAPDAIAGLYRGENLGKRLIRL